MVIVRPGRLEQQRKQVFISDRMFKVPTSQPAVSSLQQSQAQPSDMAGKRKWQEAFKGDSSSQAASSAPQHRSPQLTIFYAGAVNVYDNVPENMVRALMTLAAAKSSKPSALLNQLELQRSSSSNVGFGLLGSGQLSAATTPPKNSINAAAPTATTTIVAAATSNVASSPAFSFPVLDTTCTSLSLSSGYRPVVEERSVSASPPPPPPAPPPETTATSAAGSGVSSSSAPAVTPTVAAAAGSAALGISPRTRMQMLPTGLPQARRASIQRFLQKRKQKQVNPEDDEQAAATGIAAAHSATAEIKPTTVTSPPSAGLSISTARNTAQVPHFLKRPF